jgi:uncharacterized protein YjbI with pentapeptide repeats
LDSRLPFGHSDEGLADLRGIPLSGFCRFDGIKLSRVDFSNMEAASRLIFANSTLEDCKFDRSRARWGDMASSIKRTSFIGAKFKGSGFASTYEDCDFSKADLSGSSCTSPTFSECKLARTKLDNSVLTGCFFVNCVLAGKVKGVLFGTRIGGQMKGCDLREASFVDCTFSNFHFESCVTSNNTIIFSNWSQTVDEFAKRLEAVSDPKIRDECRTWLSVWQDRSSATPANLVDRQDWESRDGERVAAEVFGIFRAIRGDSSTSS